VNSVSFKNLTAYEIDSLHRSYNLTDGHAFRRWTPAEDAIIDRSSQPFKDRRPAQVLPALAEEPEDLVHVARAGQAETLVLACLETKGKTVASVVRWPAG
jgi:hypothetical protein